MWYSIISQDVENSLDKRMAYRPDHLARLQELADKNRLLVAGPNPIDDSEDMSKGVSGSVVIAKFDSLEQAQAWADRDPFKVNGVYKNTVVKSFKRVLP